MTTSKGIVLGQQGVLGVGEEFKYEFFKWLNTTHSPTWLQPFDEPVSSTVTAGMAGPDSSSVTNVTFGEPGLVDSERTAALFNESRIVYPRGAVTDRMHQAAGGTIMFWARADVGMDDAGHCIFFSNAGSNGNTGIYILLDDRYSVDTGFSKSFRVNITKAVNGLGNNPYNNYTGDGSESAQPLGVNVQAVVVPGQAQMFAVSHSNAESKMRLYVDGVEVAAVAQQTSYSGATSTTDPTVGALRPSDILLPHKGVLQGLTFIPAILTAAEIAEIYTKSGGPFA